MLKPCIFVVLAVAAFTSCSQAQMRGGVGRPTHGGFGNGITFIARSRALGSRGFYLGDTPYFYTDYPFQDYAAEPIAPQIVMKRSLADVPQETRSEPLLIELQGDKYVRFGGVQRSGQHEITAPPDYAEGESGIHKPRAQAEALPPAVLIYRDGHHEEVSDYAIVGSVMYARGDYWKNGYWTKNIQLSALNIPATMKTNLDNGIKFVLPAGPNEVVTRP
jgi:hypothetical protein